MPQARFRFYAELNHFLPPERRQVTFTHVFQARATIKDRIEALGVPHTEVDLILVNGDPVDFDYLVQEGDQVSVYPVFEALDIAPLARLRPKPLREPKFVLDTHLGRLAVYLRLLGFDTLYRNDYSDGELVRLAVGERRILLTKDRGILKRRVVRHGYCVRAANPREQAKEVLERFDLWNALAPFSRCLRCNGLLEAVEKRLVAERLPRSIRDTFDEFHRCGACEQVYWPGSHYEAMQRLIASIAGH